MRPFRSQWILAGVGETVRVVSLTRTAAGFARACGRMTVFLLAVAFSSAAVRVVGLALIKARPATRWRFGCAYLHRFLRFSAWLFGLEVSVRGRLPDAGTILVSNHRSYLDIAAIGSVVPTFFLAKHEVSRWPLIGPGGRAIGIPFVRRASPEDRKQALGEILARVETGFRVCNFPEGTSLSQDRPSTFRPGLFRAVVGRTVDLVPTTVRYADRSGDWVGDDTFLDHLFQVASHRRTSIEVVFSKPISASEHRDPEALRNACWNAVANPAPLPPGTMDPLHSWLRAPWKRTWTRTLRGGRYRIEVLDQPGRWMGPSAIEALRQDLREVAEKAMDQVPTYGLFGPDRNAWNHRILAICRETKTGKAVAFTAMVYLPVLRKGKRRPLIHLGLTMIGKSKRGQRLQTPLFQAIFVPAFLNQRLLSFPVSNIAASPAGIGAVSDYFVDVYPTYRAESRPKDWHLEVASQVLERFRNEFGSSEKAVFEPQTFVVRGSNDPEGGGAYQFIREDPVSRYRVDACNEYVRRLLNFPAGDELFQVGRADLVRGLWNSRSRRRGLPRKSHRASPVAS